MNESGVLIYMSDKNKVQNAKENSEIAAIISDDPVKLGALGKKYGVERTYSCGRIWSTASRRRKSSHAYDALMLPGGALNADTLRAEQTALSFIRRMNEAEKPMAVICHAPWELISAGIVRDRTLTGYHTIEDDVRNAGGHRVDHEVVVDRNWVTSRKPAGLPAFNREMVRSFACIRQMADR